MRSRDWRRRLVAAVNAGDLVADVVQVDPERRLVGTGDDELAPGVAGDDFALLHEPVEVVQRADGQQVPEGRAADGCLSIHGDLLIRR